MDVVSDCKKRRIHSPAIGFTVYGTRVLTLTAGRCGFVLGPGPKVHGFSQCFKLDVPKFRGIPSLR